MQNFKKHQEKISTPATSPPKDSASPSAFGSSSSSDTLQEESFLNPSTEYLSQVRAQIESSLLYPLSFRQRKIQGRVQMRMIIIGSGQLHSVDITQSSGYPELDELALKAVQAATPFPPIPNGRTRVQLSLPIEFKIEG